MILVFDVNKQSLLNFNTVRVTTNRSLSANEFLLLYAVNKFSNGNAALSAKLHTLILDDASSEAFFFISPQARDTVYRYCDAKGINYTKLDYDAKEIRSEDMYFAELSAKDRAYLDVLKITISFYSDFFNQSRQLVIHKYKLYASSEYKALVPKQFDLLVYLTLNEDVLFSNIDPYKHYYQHGAKEQRVYCFDNLTI